QFYEQLMAATIGSNAVLAANLRQSVLLGAATAPTGRYAMNEFVSIIQDVAKLVTGGSDLARPETRHIHDQRPRSAAERMQGYGSHSAAIVDFAGAEPPVERLVPLRSTMARVIGLGALVRDSFIRRIRVVP